MGSQKITFTGSQGDRLAAVLETPVGGGARATVLFAHCFTCGKDIFSARYLSEGLTRCGFAVLRFDFTGLGASEGEFANTNFSSNVQDLLHAADYLRRNHQAPALLVGHSLGGAAVLAAAADIPEARAVATIGAPSEPEHVGKLIKNADDGGDIEKRGEAEVLLAGRPFRIKKQFLEDIEKERLRQRVRDLNKALFIFHSVADKIVGIDNARQLYEAARHPKSFVSLDRADHLLSDKRDAAYVAGILASWAQRHLPAAESEKEDGAAGVVVVRGDGVNFTQTITNGKHRFAADEPRPLGGNDAGPTPYGYLLAALGACTSITLQMYAKLKKIPLGGVSVSLSHERVHGKDCEECDSDATGKVDKISRRISIQGDISPEQHARLLQIADKCPVHKTLSAKTLIQTSSDG